MIVKDKLNLTFFLKQIMHRNQASISHNFYNSSKFQLYYMDFPLIFLGNRLNLIEYLNSLMRMLHIFQSLAKKNIRNTINYYLSKL